MQQRNVTKRNSSLTRRLLCRFLPGGLYMSELFMRRRLQQTAMLALALTLGVRAIPGCAQQKTDGRRIFSANCAACHGLDARGAERGPDIAGRRAVQQLSDAALLRIISDGKAGTGMPPFRQLGEARIQAVLHHLRLLQGQGDATPPPGDSKSGAQLFIGKADCAKCHTASGKGGFIASDLTGYAAGKAVADIRGAIIAPNKNLDPRNATVVVVAANGETYTGIARNEDNFSLQLQTLDGAFHFLNKSELKSLARHPRSLMPDDYGSRLTEQEINDVVSYLMKIAQNQPKNSAEEE